LQASAVDARAFPAVVRADGGASAVDARVFPEIVRADLRASAVYALAFPSVVRAGGGASAVDARVFLVVVRADGGACSPLRARHFDWLAPRDRICARLGHVHPRRPGHRSRSRFTNLTECFPMETYRGGTPILLSLGCPSDAVNDCLPRLVASQQKAGRCIYPKRRLLAPAWRKQWRNKVHFCMTFLRTMKSHQSGYITSAVSKAKLITNLSRAVVLSTPIRLTGILSGCHPSSSSAQSCFL
jgi:hypothetical protein